MDRHLLRSKSMAVKHITVREKILRLFLGKPIGISIIVPGNSVKQVEISGIGGQVDGEN